ncbi:hypothetical protein [Microbacterium sp. NPDC087868]|uniref:hypothetical protein n=1 Tax=Microbacterium sp. NPDC087868 TaxID=3364195 RepID=UPI00384A60F6
MYILDLKDFYRKANEYFGSRGRVRSMNSADGKVKLLLYGVDVFYLGLPNNPRAGITFQYEVSATTRTQDFFGVRLSAVENTQEDVERAFDVIDNFARLHLPDKYLEAWEVATASK